MKQRPTSITVIAWFLIIVSAISLITTPFTMNNPVAKELMARSPIPLSIQYAMMFIGIGIGIVSGIAMLKGQNWARIFYAAWSVVSLIIALATSPAKTTLIPSILFLGIVFFFLFRPNASAYFAE